MIRLFKFDEDAGQDEKDVEGVGPEHRSNPEVGFAAKNAEEAQNQKGERVQRAVNDWPVGILVLFPLRK